ncbi:hypothetical protein J6I39_03170 [bacterium]|nr:hypothetical protein [bacterium]
MKKKFDIRKTFETFLRQPLSVLTEGLFQIVNIETDNVFSKGKSFDIDFVNGKTQLTLVNNPKMYNLFQTVLYKKKLLEQKEKASK